MLLSSLALRADSRESGPERLDSWKAIADYLGRDVRTVQRWEKEEGLPVHRLPHKKRGSVFAYKSEVDLWYARAISRCEDRQAEELAWPESAPVDDHSKRHPRKQILHAAARLVAATVLIAAGWMSGSGASPREHLRLDSLQTLPSGWTYISSVATDGFHVYYTEPTAGQSIFSELRMDGHSPTRISLALANPRILAASGAHLPMVLIDSRYGEAGQLMAFSPADHRMWKLSDETGSCAAWEPHSDWLAVCSKNRVLLVRENSATRILASLDGRTVSLAASPDGKKLAALVQRAASQESGPRALPSLELWLIESGSGRLKQAELPRLDDMGCNGSIAWGGRYVILVSRCGQNSSIWLMRPDGRLFSFGPRWVQLSRDLSRVVQALPLADPDGLLIQAEEAGPPRLMRFDPQDNNWRPESLGRNPVEADYSSDGHWVTWVEYPERTLWRSRVDGRDAKQLTFTPLRVQLPKWSPDGRRIAFSAMEPGGFWQVCLISADGQDLRKAAPDRSSQGGPTWSPDGRRLIFGDIETDNPRHHFIRMADLHSHALTIVPGSAGLRTARWSPDGRYIGAIRYSTQTLALLDVGSGKWTVAASGVGGDTLIWSSDSRSLYFDSPHQPNAGIFRYDLPTRSVSPAVAYGPYLRPPGFMPDAAGFSLAPNNSLLLTASAQSSKLWVAHVAR